jgi:uncharacterized protein YdaL
MKETPMQPKRAARFAAAAMIATMLAACGGAGKSLPAAPMPVSPAKTGVHPSEELGVYGVPSALLAGKTADQISGESDRRKGLSHNRSTQSVVVAPATLTRAVAAGAAGSGSALVLYDTTGAWGFLGELYALGIANLAGHFGSVSTEPVTAYTAGQVNQFTATVYVGSTYDEPIPAAFFSDVIASSHPVVWINDNIWRFANSVGISVFENKYGWDPTNSYFAPGGSVGNVTQVTYKNVALTRTIPSGTDGGILHPAILGGSFPAVTTLATAVDGSTSPATTFPWAIRSGNLTYIGEVPFDYTSETDRLLSFEDLLFDALAPATAAQHRALVRLEDINPGYDSTDVSNLQALATWLYNHHIPYGFGVVPVYMDPKGCYDSGTPETARFSDNPQLVTVLKYMVSHGGTLVDHGYTHQNSAAGNDPYDEITADDAEFFTATLKPANNQSCGVDVTDSVVWTGPVGGDSQAWAQGRLTSALAAFASAGFAKPAIFEVPHYAASAPDYAAIKATFTERYERALYFNGILNGGAVNGQSFIGQFFPYVVNDVYGSKVLPENLGNYEPLPSNGNPARPPAVIVHNAQVNSVVRDGFASFFFHPYYYAPGQDDGTNGRTDFQQIITGIQQAGFTFVSPGSL